MYSTYITNDMNKPSTSSTLGELALRGALALTSGIVGCGENIDQTRPVSEQDISVTIKPNGETLLKLHDISLDTKLRCARELFHEQAINREGYDWMNNNCPADQLESDWTKANCANQPGMVAEREKGNPLNSTVMLRDCILQTAGLYGDEEKWEQSCVSSPVMLVKTYKK